MITADHVFSAFNLGLMHHSFVSTAPSPFMGNSGDIHNFPSIAALLNTPYCGYKKIVKVQLFSPTHLPGNNEKQELSVDNIAPLWGHKLEEGNL